MNRDVIVIGRYHHNTLSILRSLGEGEPARKVPNPQIQPLPEHYRRPIIIRNSPFSERLGDKIIVDSRIQ